MTIDTAGRCSVCGAVIGPAETHMCGGAPSLSNLPTRVYGNFLPPDAPTGLQVTVGHLMVLVREEVRQCLSERPEIRSGPVTDEEVNQAARIKYKGGMRAALEDFISRRALSVQRDGGSDG